MSFLHSAFIENSREARDWLESIGYEPCACVGDNPEDMIFTSHESGRFHCFDKEVTTDVLAEREEIGDDDVDCRGNFPLFKAISAMRGDSDNMQWYCHQQKGKVYDLKPYFFLCKGENYIEWAKKQEPFTNTYVLAHKATLSELINHFKK